MPTANPIQLGFSTADADHPSMTYDSGNLALMFNDWQEVKRLVVFRDVARFEWTDEPSDYFDGEQYDGASVILDSTWIPSNAESNCKHYRINFNACGGRLDIACGSANLDG